MAIKKIRISILERVVKLEEVVYEIEIDISNDIADYGEYIFNLWENGDLELQQPVMKNGIKGKTEIEGFNAEIIDKLVPYEGKRT